MTEGRVYLCSWKKVGKRYRLWVTARPKVAGEGDTFEEAQAALSGAICLANGDGESQHDFDPPAPRPEGFERASIDLVLIGGGEYAWTEEMDAVFEGGLCAECKNALGPRNLSQLVISEAQAGPKNTGSVSQKRSFAGPHITFYSADFRALLTPEEDAMFEWRDVAGPPRCKKELFELAGSRVTLPFVARAGVETGGFDCEACGYASTPIPGSYQPGVPFFNVSLGDLPTSLPAVFAAGSPPDLTLVMTRERWRAMRKEKAAKGVSSSDIGVLAEADVDRKPKRATFRESVAAAVKR